MAAGLASLVYQVWKARNEILWKGKETDWIQLSARIKENVKQRVILVWPKKIGQKDENWFNSL